MCSHLFSFSHSSALELGPLHVLSPHPTFWHARASLLKRINGPILCPVLSIRAHDYIFAGLLIYFSGKPHQHGDGTGVLLAHSTVIFSLHRWSFFFFFFWRLACVRSLSLPRTTSSTQKIEGTGFFYYAQTLVGVWGSWPIVQRRFGIRELLGTLASSQQGGGEISPRRIG
ncbi:hypothetical protein EJ04DRAFT_210747 [Polyplosphaeria fusca]|uniref:Uncharacterized protein n=1 Tax=Polyplosphaeria fusca TaxID=682080 RepID=A0A9P4R7F6_9PLEO|nr:hypothetical protein EJ04DRAFT_210747 [Polyplosphaeria fusca]